MNHLRELTVLSNRYFGLRHGESEANVQRRIVSDPVVGGSAFGLTKRGEAQVRASVAAHAALDAGVRIVSSDLLRTRETAEAARAVLGAAPIALHVALRERSFGTWEGGDNASYELVWADDAKNPGHNIRDVESVLEVMARATALVAELEQRHRAERILLVSHGDCLQILRTAFLHADPATHRQREHWRPGEVRELG